VITVSVIPSAAFMMILSEPYCIEEPLAMPQGTQALRRRVATRRNREPKRIVAAVLVLDYHRIDLV